LSEEEGVDEDARQEMIESCAGRVIELLRRMRDARGWDLSRVHCFGFSDGGAVALDVASQMVGRERMGSCAVVCASLMVESAHARARYAPCVEAPTPVVLTATPRDEVVDIARTRRTAETLRTRHPGCGAEVFEFASKTRHGMVQSEEETRVLMTFWSQTLTVPKQKASDFGADVVEVAAT
jgi:predicted esterase